MTLHCHKVDDSTFVNDGKQPLDVPAGWQIADGSADDVRVCGAHPWQSNYLVFANGEKEREFNGDLYGTAACKYRDGGGNPYCIGNAQFALQ
jgi:hypothetical protein